MKKISKLKKIKYKVTNCFGVQTRGHIIDAYLLNIDEDSGIALCYHPSDFKQGECGSFEFVRKTDTVWVSAFNEECYSNAHKNSIFTDWLNSHI